MLRKEISKIENVRAVFLIKHIFSKNPMHLALGPIFLRKYFILVSIKSYFTNSSKFFLLTWFIISLRLWA